jgi:uroporphyrinogen decarboxylase
VRAAQRALGSDILVGSIVGGTVWSIEVIDDWMQFSVDLYERRDYIHQEARRRCEESKRSIDRLVDAGADFIHLVNDIADNKTTFLRPDQMREIVLPYLGEAVDHAKSAGAIPFIHTDGNVMAILDEWIGLGAACYQSVDPMAGMDIAEVKRRCHGKLALMGNVQCSLLQDGPEEAIRESARYCLESAAPGGGYVFGSSNTIFPGMPLENYDIMIDEYRRWCEETQPTGGTGGS